MSYDKLLTAGAGVWTITLTQGSATASVAGILLVTAGAREGDAVLDDEGRILVVKALTETEITFAWPYKATTRSIDLVIEQRSINRAINTASSTAAIAALTRLQNAADLAPNYPVLSHSNMPPAAPADGDRHLVGTDPTGVWAGRAEHLALYSAATAKWSFTPPEDGMSVVLTGTSTRLQYNGTAWGLDALGANGGQLSGPLDWAAAVDVASAPTVDLGGVNSNLVNITGATTIAAFGTAANGAWRLVRFAGVLTLTHGVSLVLPAGADIATATGDWALFVSRGGGAWQCAGYDRADGTPLVLGEGTVTTAKLADATVSTAKLADAAVSNTKLADMAAGTIKLRALGAGSGAPVDGTPAQARTLLGFPTPSIVGRLGRFADTAGTLGQSLISDDGAGNLSGIVSLSGSNQISANTLVASTNITSHGSLNVASGISANTITTNTNITTHGTANIGANLAANGTISAGGALVAPLVSGDKLRHHGNPTQWSMETTWYVTLANDGEIIFTNGSGSLLISNHHHGSTALFLLGGGSVKLLGSSTGVYAENALVDGNICVGYYAPGGYYWLRNRMGATTTVGIFATKTRPNN